MSMNSDLAQQIVEHRDRGNTTWREAINTIVPHLFYNSVRAYVNKFINNKLGDQREGRPKIKKKAIIDYSVLTKEWV